MSGESGTISGRKLVIVGDSAFAEIASEYFTHDMGYEVVAFAVEKAYLTRVQFHGRPVVAFEDLPEQFPPGSHDAFVAVAYGQLNRLRTRLVRATKDAGYRLASYISPRAFVWRNVSLGEHCFIFENNVVQPFVTLGSNVILWSGNHIGHRSKIGDNVYVSSHVVVSGFCEIGDNCFLGVNSTIANNVKVAKDCWLGPGVVISSDTKEREIYRPPASQVAKVDSWRFFKVKDEP